MSNEIKVGDRVRIVNSRFVEHPSRMAGGTGTVERVTYELFHVRVDNDPHLYDGTWSFYQSDLEPLVEETEQIETIEEDEETWNVGDYVRVGRDNSGHGFPPGTVARVVEVIGTSVDEGSPDLLVTTRTDNGEPDEYNEGKFYFPWQHGITAYVSPAGTDWRIDDDVTKVDSTAVRTVDYQEFVDTIARDGLVAAFERFNITHK